MSKVAVVTGGTSGIGRATALALKDAGYTVYELSRRAEGVEGLHHIAADVTDQQAVNDAAAQIMAAEGRIDVLVNNAGFGISGAIEFTAMDEIRRQFDVNLFGTVRCIQAVLPAMREAHGGCILNLSSVAGVLPIPFQSFYSAVKASVNALTLTLQNELRPYGVRVAAMLPGDVKTGFTAAREKNCKGAEVYPALLRSISTMEHDEQNGMSPARIADRLYRISRERNPKGLYSCGIQYQACLLLGKLLPVRLYNWILAKMYA